MVKRVVDTDFWTDMDVIDRYSPEDKFFYLYLITNGKSSQVGIYSLPIKVISFETGYSSEATQVLIERFSDKYKQIVYSKETQEVAILKSLEFSILKGGKPVSDLLEKELSLVKDANLIQVTFDAMLNFWELSKRPFDKIIKQIFENELMNRGLSFNQNEKENQNNNDNKNDSKNDHQNDNHNEESWTTNRRTNRRTNRASADEQADEQAILEHYANLLKKCNPELQNKITANNIVKLYYQEMLGDVPKYIENQLKSWQEQIPKSLVLEALSRSLKASHPLPYASTVIDNWVKSGVETYSDALKLDSKYDTKSL